MAQEVGFLCVETGHVIVYTGDSQGGVIDSRTLVKRQPLRFVQLYTVHIVHTYLLDNLHLAALCCTRGGGLARGGHIRDHCSPVGQHRGWKGREQHPNPFRILTSLLKVL